MADIFDNDGHWSSPMFDNPIGGSYGPAERNAAREWPRDIPTQSPGSCQTSHLQDGKILRLLKCDRAAGVSEFREGDDIVTREIATSREIARRPFVEHRSQREWIQTYTGRQFWPLEPRVADVCILDIAHALANMCRFSGHTLGFYSVAQHSVIGSRHCDAPLEFLLHDATEAYLVDLPRPLKRSPAFRDVYRAAEERLGRVIASAYSLPWPLPASVKEMDERMLATERRDVMRTTNLAWQPLAEPLPIKLRCWPPYEAKVAFLNRFQELSDQRFAVLKSCRLIPRTDSLSLAI